MPRSAAFRQRLQQHVQPRVDAAGLTTGPARSSRRWRPASSSARCWSTSSPVAPGLSAAGHDITTLMGKVAVPRLRRRAGRAPHDLGRRRRHRRRNPVPPAGHRQRLGLCCSASRTPRPWSNTHLSILPPSASLARRSGPTVSRGCPQDRAGPARRPRIRRLAAGRKEPPAGNFRNTISLPVSCRMESAYNTIWSIRGKKFRGAAPRPFGYFAIKASKRALPRRCLSIRRTRPP